MKTFLLIVAIIIIGCENSSTSNYQNMTIVDEITTDGPNLNITKFEVEADKIEIKVNHYYEDPIWKLEAKLSQSDIYPPLIILNFAFVGHGTTINSVESLQFSKKELKSAFGSGTYQFRIVNDQRDTTYIGKI